MKEYFGKYTSAAPLAVFRIGLGIMTLIGIIRFWYNGWIEDLYIKPKYFFPYYGFEFITPLGTYTYVLFAVCALSAIFVAIGLYYRIASICLFLSFTYIELMDKTTYLNHYYFISMICLLMVFLPAHAFYSVDALRNSQLRAARVPCWTIDSIKLFVCFLYVFAGIAKINSDWLLKALPLKIWLPAQNDIPVIGFIFNYSWVHYLFSWFGCVYDLTVGIFLWNQRTRPWAYATVILFHLLTSLLFQIGMFPYVMMVTALIFFSGNFHMTIIRGINRILRVSEDLVKSDNNFVYSVSASRFIKGFLICFFAIQLIMPFRYLLYPGELFWTEEGYRFSWRVMLMEKAGYTQFTVRDNTGKIVVVNNNDFLTPLQEKMMATQPDMVLQYAHILRDHFIQQGFHEPEVYADSYVALNGRLGKALVDPKVNLAMERESLEHKSWILSYDK